MLNRREIKYAFQSTLAVIKNTLVFMTSLNLKQGFTELKEKSRIPAITVHTARVPEELCQRFFYLLITL